MGLDMSGMLPPPGGPVGTGQNPNEPLTHVGNAPQPRLHRDVISYGVYSQRHTTLPQTALTSLPWQFRKQTQRGQGINQSCRAKRKHAWGLNQLWFSSNPIPVTFRWNSPTPVGIFWALGSCTCGTSERKPMCSGKMSARMEAVSQEYTK